MYFKLVLLSCCCKQLVDGGARETMRCQLHPHAFFFNLAQKKMLKSLLTPNCDKANKGS